MSHLTPARSPQSKVDYAAEQMLQSKHPGLGMRVVEKEDGVYISQMALGGAAASAQPFLQIGDRVVSIDGEPVRSEGDVKRLASGAHGTSLM